MAEQKKQKLNVKKTILTGFGFLATSIAWAIYDPYITKILNKILSESELVTNLSAALARAIPWIGEFAEAQGQSTISATGGFSLVPLFIGIIMTFDNIFGVIFQPTFGKLSDNCHSKLGKRRPFIVSCAPISAILFALIPIVALNTEGSLQLPLTMITVILFVFSMSLWRAPVVALMPDLTPPELRSEGNAIINLMGGIGSAVGMVAGTIGIALCTLFAGYSKAEIKADETVSFPYVFIVGSLVMIIGMLVLLFFVKEEDTSIVLKGDKNQYADQKALKKAQKEAAKQKKAELKAMKLSKGERKSLAFMLGTLFFLFCASNAITTFFSLFAQEILHMITSEATFIMLIFAVCSGVAAIPAGKFGSKFGRKKTIIGGLAVFLVAFIVFFGVFLGMLGGKDLSINNYVTVNNAYIAVDENINAYNATVSDKAQAEGRTLAEDEVLSIEGYLAYKSGEEQTDAVKGYYDAYEVHLVSTLGEGIFDEIINVANTVLGTEAATVDAALGAIVETVNSVTKILRVLIYPVLVLGGAANMFITVNTLPLVLEIGGVEKVGTFTGYYYTATFSAQIASPIVYGFIRMFAGTYMSLFYYSPIMFALAIILIMFVKHGEAVPQEIIDKIEEENAD
ncbi:MAG: SLC45 family MFS transporter [Ruminococcaceae bacterium]|nr:SLC45 family MFS transporter [Oscillospiraceae bacterium]